MRILVVKPSSLGDVLHAFPAVARLHRAFPMARFDWLIHPGCAPILDYAPIPLERRILFRRRELGSWRLPVEMTSLVRELRREPYDLVIDFQGLLRSALFGRSARARRICGFAAPREKCARLFYREVYPIPMGLHAVERNWALAGAVAQEAPAPVLIPELPEVPAHALKARGILTASGWNGEPLLAVAPGARWVSKSWAPERFAGVLKRLRERGLPHRFVLLGAPAEMEAARKIAAEIPTVNLAGKTGLGELMEILRLCDTLLCNDSGPMHFMAALGKPVAAFFGPTQAELTGPYGAGHRIFRRDDLECSGCLARECPGQGMKCHQIDEESVAETVAAMLSGKEGS